MPVDISGLGAGIADVKFSYPIHLKRRAEATVLRYMFAIIRLYLYAYLFVITSLISGPLSVCAAVISTLVHHFTSIFPSHEVTIAFDSIVINFILLTLYAYAAVFFVVPFGKFILNFGQNHAFHAVELIGNKLRFVLVQLVFLFYILSLAISHFITGKFIKESQSRGFCIKFLRFCQWNLSGVCECDKIKISLIDASSLTI